MSARGQGRLNRPGRDITLSLDDRLRRDAIEQILSQFRLDLERQRAAYGDVAEG